MKIQKDYRMEIVDEESALTKPLYNLAYLQIYIKHVNNNLNEDKTEQIVTYTKFKVKNVYVDSKTILIYGTEDDDRLVIDTESIISYQMTQIRDELYIQIVS